MRRKIATLLLVEDNPGDARLLREMFVEGSPKTEVTHVESMGEAEKYLAQHAVDVVVLDLGLPDTEGLETVRRAHVTASCIPLVVLTSNDDESLALQALQKGAQDYLIKGQIDTRTLLRAVRYAIERKNCEEALIAERKRSGQERQRTDEVIRASEARLRHLLDSNIIGVVFWNTKGDILNANDLFLKMIGYSREDLQRGNLRCSDVTPPEYVAIGSKALVEMAATGTCAPFEKELIRKDGRRVTVLVGSALLEGQGDSGTSFVMDITERKQAETRLHLQSAALNAAANAMVIAERDGMIAWINPAFTELTGYTEEEARNERPPNNYQLKASAPGFSSEQQSLTVRTSVPISVKIPLAVTSASETVTITSDTAQALENTSTTHTDVDQSLITRLPVRSVGSGLSDVVTLAAPGVVADSNGFFHPLGDHAQTSYSIDNQPVSDQQSKAFSTQLPPNAIQSMEIITGSTPAEYGDKTSLVVNAITKSGLNQKKPTGDFSTTYGTFGTIGQDASLGFGSAKAGNFVTLNFERSRRFLDSPESTVLHDKGSAGSIFDRMDYSPNSKDTFHLNLFFARNSFQTPNQFDQQALGQDQRQLVHSVNIAPGYVHIFSATTVLSVNPYYRLDNVKYFASPNPFSDQTMTFSQSRRLNNVGVKADLSYVKGRNNAKFGVQLSHTFLTESFKFGITDPDFNDPASPDFLPGLLPFDLTRGGQQFNFRGHTDIKQEAFYAQDILTLGQAAVSLGLRFDNYDGITKGKLLQPRLGLSYHLKSTGTVLRGSFMRSFESPYNENLILSSVTGAGGLANGVLGDTSNLPLRPGARTQVNAGFQQAIGKHLLLVLVLH